MRLFFRQLCLYTFPCLATPLSVEPLTSWCSDGSCGNGSTIGAVLRDVPQNVAAMTSEDIAAIEQGLAEHKVVVFPMGGCDLTPFAQVELAKKLGHVNPDIAVDPEAVRRGVLRALRALDDGDARRSEAEANLEASVEPLVRANAVADKQVEGLPPGVTRLVMEPGMPVAFGEGLHADVTFAEVPPLFTFLLARELPGGGDDTSFVDMRSAYENLPLETQQELRGLTAVHDDSGGKTSVHPMITAHPAHGKPVLFVNQHFTTKVIGYHEDASRALLERLFAHIESQPVFHFKWTCTSELPPGCNSCLPAIIWDNRQVLHAANSDWTRDAQFEGRRREMHRITVGGGERPLAFDVACHDSTCVAPLD